MFGKEKQSKPELEYFTIHDSKTGAYKEPMLAINRHDMLRQIDNLFRDPNQKLNQLLTNAEDFSLFKIGEYCKSTGTITSTKHEHIANLIDLRTSATQHLGIVPT